MVEAERQRSSTPENEPKKSLVVRIENAQKIFKAIEQGESGLLGKELLSKPITAVIIRLESEKGEKEFDLYAEFIIDGTYDASDDEKNKEAKIKNEICGEIIRSIDNNGKEKGGGFNFKGNKGTKLLMDVKSIYGNINFSTGTIKTQQFGI